MQEKEIEFDTFVDLCGGTEVRKKKNPHYPGSWGNQAEYHYSRHITGEPVTIPDNVFVKVTATATKGSVGKLVAVEFAHWGADTQNKEYHNRITSYDTTFIYQVEGRKGTNRVKNGHAQLYLNYAGPTVFKRTDPSKKPKVTIPEHVNKYGQTIRVGDYVAGIGARKTLYFGKVTRYSKSSIWVKSVGDHGSQKGEHCINTPKETFALPTADDEVFEQEIMMMVLKGWSGYQ